MRKMNLGMERQDQQKDIWESQYKQQLGFKAQRLYPNEELLCFIGKHYLNKSVDRHRLRILELGCGSGANLWMLAKEGFDAFGVDASNESLKLCSKMLKHWQVKAKIFLANMLQLPFKSNSFDAVVDVVSMQHLLFSQHTKAYAEVYRVLRPGGLFFSYHLENKSVSFHRGGGRKIDRYTLDNISNRLVLLANNGVTCFPTESAIQSILKINK